MPLLTHTSLDPMSPLSFPLLHLILEDFSTPLLSQCPASLHASLLQIFSISPRSLKSLTNCLLILFSFLKGQNTSSTIPRYLFCKQYSFIILNIVISPYICLSFLLVYVDTFTRTNSFSILSFFKARPGSVCPKIPCFYISQIFYTQK